MSSEYTQEEFDRRIQEGLKRAHYERAVAMQAGFAAAKAAVIAFFKQNTAKTEGQTDGSIHHGGPVSAH